MFIAFNIGENERGLLIKNGHIVEWLEPGQYHRFALFSRLELQRHDADVLISPYTPELARVVPQSANQEILFVAQGKLGLVIRNGIPDQFIYPGRYFIWRVKSKLEVRLISEEYCLNYASDILLDTKPPLQFKHLHVLPFERSFTYLDGFLVDIARPRVNKCQPLQIPVMKSTLDGKNAEMTTCDLSLVNAVAAMAHGGWLTWRRP
jgi:hypothetical protein